MVKDLRGYVSLVPQEVYINDGSVEENLKFIHIFSLKIMKELYHRLEQVALQIQRPRNEINQFLTEKIAKSLSGGERKRLAFARAFYQQKGLMMIDEGTSGLDNDTKMFYLM